MGFPGDPIVSWTLSFCMCPNQRGGLEKYKDMQAF